MRRCHAAVRKVPIVSVLPVVAVALQVARSAVFAPHFSFAAPAVAALALGAGKIGRLVAGVPSYVGAAFSSLKKGGGWDSTGIHTI